MRAGAEPGSAALCAAPLLATGYGVRGCSPQAPLLHAHTLTHSCAPWSCLHRTRLALSATSHHCGQTAWCIRVPHKAENKKLRDRLINFVELGIEGVQSPNLIISVVGDAYRVADKTMEQNLTSGLTKIAQSLVLWLSTPGTDSGITQYLGFEMDDRGLVRKQYISLGLSGGGGGSTANTLFLKHVSASQNHKSYTL